MNRTILKEIQSLIEKGNGATEAELKALWNQLSDAITQTEQLNLPESIIPFNTKSKRMIKVISGNDVFEGEVTAMRWDIDQWAFMVDGEWYCQSEVYCL